VEEALNQGICEVVERHVSSIVSQNKLGTPAIKRDSITDATVLEMMTKYERAGIRLSISDFSIDTGIPSVGVLGLDPSTFPERSEIVWTAGTTPHPEKALSRALTEVAQLAGDFNTSSNYVASGLPKLKTLEEAHFITHPKGEVSISELPDLSHDNIRVEVENCVSALSNIGMEVIVVNVMHPLLQIPAFYTIIPGAHFRERADGRSVGMFSAKLIAESGDPEGAISELHDIDILMPGKYYVKFYLGSCHLQMNQPREALKYLEEALNLGPKEEDTASIYSYMAVCLKDLGQYRQAITFLEKGERYDKERTDIYNLMGFCYFKLKEHEKAVECFQQVLRLDPSSAIDYANIASNYRDMGQTEQAVRYYKLALELDPSIEFARDNLDRLQQG
jgi:ribosomal protein S12 methylthiotransferase accessory factor